jgi:hypothetical protein
MYRILNGLRAPEVQTDCKVRFSVKRRRRIAGARLPDFFMAIPALVVGLALAGSLVQARADITSSCGNTSVTEGQPGAVFCVVTNDDPAQAVFIRGEFAFSYSVGGDASDKLLSVRVFGPFPTGPDQALYVIDFTTPNDGPESDKDFGLNDVSLLLDAEDANTGDFIFGEYNSAAVSVYDIGLPPMDPVTVIPPIFLDTEDDYFDNIEEDRGYVNNTPEPAPLLMVGSGLAALTGMVRRRRA